jgi:hypothetical protein
MGQYSFFLTTRNNAESCLIDWDAMDTSVIFNSRVLEECFLEKEDYPTLQQVAERFHETKFIGYIGHQMISALLEFNENLVPCGSSPRIYYDYEGADEVWCLEFTPGADFINLLLFSYGHLLPSGDEYGYGTARRRILSTIPEQHNWKRIRLQKMIALSV